jgi:transposase
MGRPRNSDPELEDQARAAVKNATTLEEFRAAQAVLLPAEMGTTLAQTAALMGVSRANVNLLQAKFRRAQIIGPQLPRSWGGRRNALLGMDEEREFLAPWLEQAKAGGMLVVSPVRAALAQKLGRPIKASVAYRLLARHGWRKVAPDTAHPKNDPLAQADWKKNSRKNWRAC